MESDNVFAEHIIVLAQQLEETFYGFVNEAQRQGNPIRVSDAHMSAIVFLTAIVDRICRENGNRPDVRETLTHHTCQVITGTLMEGNPIRLWALANIANERGGRGTAPGEQGA
jgi:hypothetical protein